RGRLPVLTAVVGAEVRLVGSTRIRSHQGQDLTSFAQTGPFDRLCRAVSSIGTYGRILAVARKVGPVTGHVVGQTDVLIGAAPFPEGFLGVEDRKSTRLNSSHVKISYA